MSDSWSPSDYQSANDETPRDTRPPAVSPQSRPPFQTSSSFSNSYFPPPSSPLVRSTSPTARRSNTASTARFARSASASSARRRNHSVSSVGVPQGRAYDEQDAFTEEEEHRGGDPYTADLPESLPRPDVEDDDSPGDESPDPGTAPLQEEDPTSLKYRQSLMNVQHPFGLPIWKPALYKKSRTITRTAETALHAEPSAIAERHLLPGNILWTLLFGWWLCLAFFLAAFLLLIPFGGYQYAQLVYGLGWYMFWPFGKYVEGDMSLQETDEDEDDDGEDDDEDDEDEDYDADASLGAPPLRHRMYSDASGESTGTVKAAPQQDDYGTARRVSQQIRPTSMTSDIFIPHHEQTASWQPTASDRSALLPARSDAPKSYGTRVRSRSNSRAPGDSWSINTTPAPHLLAQIAFWLAFICIIAPLMLVVTLICWALVVTIPMAKLNWALFKHLYKHPLSIRFRAAPLTTVLTSSADPALTMNGGNINAGGSRPTGSAPPIPITYRTAARLEAGQAAPSGKSTVLLCTYRAVGLKYYKYTIGSVNIMFVNLMPLVFFVIFDAFVILPYAEKRAEEGRPLTGLLAFLASRAAIFVFCLVSVIPLSYFIGMAVASISAQSSIGMGAVINATFGSIIEIILYALLLIQGKGRLVEGSIVGSLLAGVLVMPGVSMLSGALRKKEQKFNAKSAGVTSTMLIMAIIGTLTPTLFYQTYGNFELVCEGCPIDSGSTPGQDLPWSCKHCFYKHPDPTNDPFYQETVKSFMYFCAAILLFSYLIGLWFSLRTHASQIWQNPQQLMHPLEAPPAMQHRMSIYNRMLNPAGTLPTHRLNRKASTATTRTTGSTAQGQGQGQGYAYGPSVTNTPYLGPQTNLNLAPPSPIQTRRQISTSRGANHAAGANANAGANGQGQGQGQGQAQGSGSAGLAPLIESVNNAVKSTTAGMSSIQLPPSLSTDEFTRAVTVATVSALRHEHQHEGRVKGHVSGAMHGGMGGMGGPGAEGHDDGHGGHGGHDAPAWSRFTSASVLLGCTAIYAIIAEILTDVVDAVLQGSAIDEKFLGITVFALIPNTTEFMNAMSFAMNGNIALSMEIGSAYALQVCLLQIPAMVAFSAWYDPKHMGTGSDTFTLIFPRWDVIAIIFSVFLLTYTYIEAKSNYHRGSILILSYLVLAAGFFYAPDMLPETETGLGQGFSATSFANASSLSMSWAQYLATLLASIWTQ
ncbi:hypothetical protein BOTBODRAFT_36709 [Botryobasidium botryosum FD-172 SS1]|uniref:Sodium/calcium exchanger membrane region domain-containing protein n=1 Tax=Botryobasidium botryosum (strain FD-172 SS1) TaxID=930990 RepID=A0A067MEA1_BOTB1|nr:hypothetical protein BOTBODRAFT_36709 [Botryobasidium botryosum FD-172 SS1]